MTEKHQGARVLLTATTVFACTLAGTAQAQQQGTYQGTTRNGQLVDIMVGYDSATGNYDVTGVSFIFVQNCKKGEKFGLSIGIGLGNNQDILNGKFSHKTTNPDEYIPFSMTFEGTTSVKGTVALLSPAFNPPNNYPTPPKTYQLCTSKEPFTASFQGAGALNRWPAGSVTTRVFEPRGN